MRHMPNQVPCDAVLVTANSKHSSRSLASSHAVREGEETSLKSSVKQM
jgi:hypothetical protein